jgi:hypothetical protein
MHRHIYSIKNKLLLIVHKRHLWKINDTLTMYVDNKILIILIDNNVVSTDRKMDR